MKSIIDIIPFNYNFTVKYSLNVLQIEAKLKYKNQRDASQAYNILKIGFQTHLRNCDFILQRR